MVKNRRRALLVVLALVASVAAVAGSAGAYPGGPWFKPNEPYDQNFADPSVVRDGTTYYAYATSTGGANLPVMTSTDLRTWVARDKYPAPACANDPDPFYNDAFPCPPSWGTEIWAPGAAKIGNHWVVWYSYRLAAQPNRFCLSVATSDGPLGPFVDNSTGPYYCDADPNGSIDPQPFVDADGVPWLIWKSEGYPCNPQCIPQRIWSRRLNAAGTGFDPGDGSAHLLFTATWPDPNTWEATVAETPAMVRYKGQIIVFYSGNIWHSDRYGIGYSVCDSPIGPCTKMTTNAPWKGTSGDENGPGGATPFIDAAGNLQLAYQYWNPPYSDYPTDPGCDGIDPDTHQPYCVSQGQRRMRIQQVYATSFGLSTARSTEHACPGGDNAGFGDVPSSNPHSGNVNCLVDGWDIARGTGPGQYNPGGSVTRGQMATFIANLIRQSGGTLPNNPPDAFTDDNGSVHEPNINALAAANIVSGTSATTYAPGRVISRAQMATFLVKAYEYRTGKTLEQRRDWFREDNGSTHEANINKAADAGFTSGVSFNTYAINGLVHRDQMATFLTRVLDRLVTDDGAHRP
jgi:hypothetical protein